MNFVLLIKAKDESHLDKKIDKLYMCGSGNCHEKYISLIDITNEEIENFNKYKKNNNDFYSYVREYDNKIILEKDFIDMPEEKLKNFYKIVVIDNKENKNVLKVIKPYNRNGILDSYKKTSIGEGYFRMKDGRILASNLKLIEGMPKYDRHIENINKLDYDDPDWNDLFFNKASFLHKETEEFYIKEAEKDYELYQSLAKRLNFKTLGFILKKYKINYKLWAETDFILRQQNEIYQKAWKEYCNQDFLKEIRESYLTNKLNHFIYMNPEVLILWDKEKYINYKKMNTISCYKFFDNKKVHSKPNLKTGSQLQKLDGYYKWAKKVYNFINTKTPEKLYILDCHK